MLSVGSSVGGLTVGSSVGEQLPVGKSVWELPVEGSAGVLSDGSSEYGLMAESSEGLLAGSSV